MAETKKTPAVKSTAGAKSTSAKKTSSAKLTEAEKKKRARKKAQLERKGRRRRTLAGVFAVLLLAGVLVLIGKGILKHYTDMIVHGEESVAILDSVPMQEESYAESHEESQAEESRQESKAEESKPETVPDPPVSDEFELKNWKNYSGNVYRCDGVINFLLIGIDTRGTVTYMNTDVMMVVTVNENTKEISLTSLQRDCLVYIPKIRGEGAYGRLNAAAAWGGIPLLIETIETNFNIHIDHYAKVNFNSFIDIINMIGGVTVELSEEEVAAVNADLDTRFWGNRPLTYDPNEKLPAGAGKKTMNGTQALTYARLRRIDSDFGRTERQRKVITAVISKAKKMSLTQLNEMAEAVLPYMEVDEGLDEVAIFKLISKALAQYIDYDMNSYRLPVWQLYENYTLAQDTGVTPKGAMILMLDFEANVDYFFEKVYHE